MEHRPRDEKGSGGGSRLRPECLHCRYDLSGISTDAMCPECGRPVWPDVASLASQYARQYARVETSFYAACLALLLSFACGPFGVLMAAWAITQSARAVMHRNTGVLNMGARNMPFISLGVSILAGAVSLGAMVLWLA